MKSLLAFVSVLLLAAASAVQAQPFAYITNQNSNNVSVIDIATNTVVTTVAVGINPEGVAVNPAGTPAYVTNRNSNNVSVIDTASNMVVGTVAVGTGPRGVAVNPAGTRVYVTNYNSNTVSVIDTATNTVVATVPVGVLPWGVAVNPAGTLAYVANFNSGTVSVIDTATNAVVATVAVFGAHSVAVNSAGTRVYVAKSNGLVAVIDTTTNPNTVVATVSVGGVPQTVAVNPADTRVYVTNSDNVSDGVSVIDTATNSVVATVAVGLGPIGVAVNPAGTRAYVANFGSNTVSVIDTATNAVVATVPVGTNPVAFGLFIGPAAAAPLSLIGVQSRKDHGAAGTHNLPVDTGVPITGAVTVESRVIGTGHRIVFVFSEPVTSLGSATAVNGAGQAVSGTVSAIGSEITVTLPTVPDNSRVLITLTGVNGTIDATAAVGFLVGDVNNTRSVNSSDISGVKARSGQSTTALNFKFDVNASGAINSSDISAIKARSGLVLP